MKTLLLGGTGLISTAITRFLVQRGDQVTMYNRGKSQARTPPGPKVILGDRKDVAVFEQQMKEAGTFDCVIDMICYLPGDAESDVRAFKGRCGQLIFCSTVDVYTKPATRYPYTENEPLSGVSLYGKSKVKCEGIFAAANGADLPVTIIRPAYTYGEGRPLLNWWHRDDCLIDRLRKNRPVIVHGDGMSLWVSAHIDDVGRAFAAAAGNSATFGKAYHATGEEWMTWNQYYQVLAQAVSAPAPRLVHIPSDLLAKLAPKRGSAVVENFQFDNIFDNSAAARDLGYCYTISWLEGAKRVATWLEANDMAKNSDDDTIDDQIVAAWQSMSASLADQLQPLDA
jgi:nucleoside-diphosphate-sugar epimerase